MPTSSLTSKKLLPKNDELSHLLDDRGSSSPINLFQSLRNKEKGVSSGFVGKKDKSVYILKSGEMGFNEAPAHNKTRAADKRDLVSEYVTSSLYERILKNRTPKIGLAESSDPSHRDNIYLKSKFLPEFQDIREYKKYNSGPLEIDGFEKVMAACLFMGEIDYHDQNIGVARDVKNRENHAVKIDHGRTGLGLVDYKDEQSIMRSFSDSVAKLGLSRINIRANKFKEAIDEISSISDDEIDHLIQNRIDNLRNTGFKLNSKYSGYGIRLGTKIVDHNNPGEGELGFTIDANNSYIFTTKDKPSLKIDVSPEGNLSYIDNGERKNLPRELNPAYSRTRSEWFDKILDFTSSIGYTKDEQKIRYDNLEKFYTSNIKLQKSIFQEIGKTLDVISKIDGNDAFKRVGWLKKIYGGEAKKDPLAVAIEEKFTIEGINPAVWSTRQNEVSRSSEQEVKLIISNLKGSFRDSTNSTKDNNKTAKLMTNNYRTH